MSFAWRARVAVEVRYGWSESDADDVLHCVARNRNHHEAGKRLAEPMSGITDD